MLTRLNPADLAMFSRASRACRRAVIDSGLVERDGTDLSLGFKVEDFVARGGPPFVRLSARPTVSLHRGVHVLYTVGHW